MAVLLISLCTASCTRSASAPSSTVNKRIAATFYPIYIMCLNITDGVEGVELSCLTPPGTGCLHDYSLTTRDAMSLEKADIIVANGAGMESFLGQLLESNAGKIIVAAEGYPLIDDNPHIFVSVTGARYQVKAIADGLSRLDGAHADEYAANAAKYDAVLVSLSDEMHTALDPYHGRGIVTFHEAFPYFAQEFGFDVLSVIEREPGTAPSAKEIAQTVRLIKEEIAAGTPPALFAEPQYPHAAADIIKNETGLEVTSLDPCVTGEMKADAYIEAQRGNVTSLLQAFGGTYEPKDIRSNSGRQVEGAD